MKKILAVTGIRSEYYILRPVLFALKDSKRFDVGVVFSGAHLSDWHNNSGQEIEKDGFKIVDRIDSLFMTNRKTQRVKGISCLLYGLAQTVERERPDFLLVVGDREEAIATALVGNYMDVLVAHIGGGETVFGNADDPIRFAVSKLAHIHFTTAKQYADNLRKIGEEEFRIFWVGNPALDGIRTIANLPWNKIKHTLGWNEIEPFRYIVFIKHPLSSEKDGAYRQMKFSLRTLKKFAQKYCIKVVGIYPNTDPGSYDMIKAIEEEEDSSLMRFYRCLPQEVFVTLLRNTLVLVGNSSMGILEAPFYKLPVVNIGRRQQGRLTSGNVEFVDYNERQILSALEKACFDVGYREYVKNLDNPFGDGRAGERIVQILSEIDSNDKNWLVKKKLV